ncbi:hypothetical protein EVAR_33317_1 [Eumeta japonica]|uniref:Uncharacterized protein n=1 Tax=Eumeta variegata TaxID=151549 RepID=A0A4C1WF10_EUMVA|nr:hypothetical protein EVAR_33317_1 [Eumeta japonica]
MEVVRIDFVGVSGAERRPPRCGLALYCQVYQHGTGKDDSPTREAGEGGQVARAQRGMLEKLIEMTETGIRNAVSASEPGTRQTTFRENPCENRLVPSASRAGGARRAPSRAGVGLRTARVGLRAAVTRCDGTGRYGDAAKVTLEIRSEESFVRLTVPRMHTEASDAVTSPVTAPVPR